jgi:hypothetical protein
MNYYPQVFLFLSADYSQGQLIFKGAHELDTLCLG